MLPVITVSLMASTVAKMLVPKIGAKIGKALTQAKATGYEQELMRIIDATIKDYSMVSPAPESGNIAFYQSQVFLDALLTFRLTKEMDKEALQQLLADDSRILDPSESELNAFFEIFDQQVRSNKKLSKLQIEDNYKEAIFQILEDLQSQKDNTNHLFKELREDIRSSQGQSALLPEWNRQLDEIQSDIHSFRPITGRRRLDQLEKRIVEHDLSTDRLIARISFLKVQCLLQLEGDPRQEEIESLALKSYNLQKTNIEYKALAIQVFYTQNEPKKASDLCEEILAEDGHHRMAWLVKCFLAEDKFSDVLSLVPETVKNKAFFKLRFFQWMRSKMYLRSIAELEKIGLSLDGNIDTTTPVNSQTRYEKLMTSAYLLVKAFGPTQSIQQTLQHPALREDSSLQIANKLLHQITDAIRHTEIEASYRYVEFLWHTTNFILTEDLREISSMEAAFSGMRIKDTDTVLKMAQGYNSLASPDATRKGIALLEQYQDNNHLFLFFNTANYATIGDFASAQTTLLRYLSMRTAIDREAVDHFHIFMRQFNFRKHLPFKEAVLAYLDKATFEKPAFRKLMLLSLYLSGQMPEMTEKAVAQLLEELRQEIDPADEKISLQIAIGYAMIDQYAIIYEYLSPLVNRERPSELLLIYCKAMYHIQGHKVELMGLLKKWREELGPEYDLLKIEAYLHKLHRSWIDVMAVTRIALSVFPDDEEFLMFLLEAAEMATAFDEIVSRVPLVKGRSFQREFAGILVAKAMIKAGQYQVALDILYQQASNPNNTKSRQAYVTLSNDYPSGLLVEYPTVNMGSWVRVEQKGQTRLLEMLESNKKNFPQNQLLHKSVGEEIPYKNSILDTLEVIKVKRIMNKYLALFDEIVHEGENALSGLGFSTFSFDEGKPEQLLATMMKHFGPKGAVESERLANERRKYAAGELSFTEITSSVFRGHFVDAYFTLTSDSEQGFRAITPAITRAVLSENSIYVLDFSSFCLFFELTNQLALVVPQKFVVSHFLQNMIREELSEANDVTQPEFSLSFGVNSVTKHEYSENFRTSRIATFQAMLQWIDDHCLVDKAPESIDYITEIPQDQQENQLLHLLLANRILPVRENHFLLTNDTFYYRHLGCAPDKVISPLSYLQQVHPALTPSATEFMLKRNYVGIPLTLEILQGELLKMLTGQPDKFSICLKNLPFSWNPEPSHFLVVAGFLRLFYLMPAIPPGTRQNIVSTVLTAFVTGMSDRDKMRTEAFIKKEFFFLGSSLDEVLSIYHQLSRNSG
jgi:hypothetical protein